MNGLLSFCHFCELHGPRVLMCTQAFGKDEDRNVTTDFGFDTTLESNIAASSARHSDDCMACKWMHTDKGFVTQDASHVYLSSYRPLCSDLYSTLRQACVRSLSCEASPGREGPVLFGDDRQGHVYSYTFALSDPQARGFQRWYSFLFISADQHKLIGSWHFLGEHFRDLISRLQQKVETAVRSDDEFANIPLSRSMGHSRPDYLRQRGSKPLRALEELTRDPNIMALVHGILAWVLKNYSERMIEKIVDGPACLAKAVEESDMGRASPASLGMMSGRISMAASERASMHSSVFGSLQELFDAMEASHFFLVLYHLLIGNQIIVRGAEPALVASVLTSLAALLPAGCCGLMLDQAEYRESYRCNLLGLRGNVEIPVSPCTYVLIDLKRYHELTTNPATRALIENDDNDDEDIIFILRTNETQGVQSPLNSLIVELKKILDAELSETVLQVQIATLREQWCQYAKVYFKLSRRVDANADHIEAFIQAFGLCEEDLLVLRFWTQALSRHHRVALVSNRVD